MDAWAQRRAVGRRRPHPLDHTTRQVGPTTRLGRSFAQNGAGRLLRATSWFLSMPRRPPSALGERARAIRTRLGLNQSEVAERIGISNEVYGRLERGVTMPRVTTLLRLCGALGVQPNDLLTISSEATSCDEVRPELRQLTAILERADELVIKRVTEVARWLLAAAPPGSSSNLRPASPRARRGARR